MKFDDRPSIKIARSYHLREAWEHLKLALRPRVTYVTVTPSEHNQALDYIINHECLTPTQREFLRRHEEIHRDLPPYDEDMMRAAIDYREKLAVADRQDYARYGETKDFGFGGRLGLDWQLEMLRSLPDEELEERYQSWLRGNRA